ncbi:MAG: serine/threonine-protein kinase RsbW [Solirubrobacteraceae bacterium]|jgi:anti-sigma regulatory factor (Ser/Thr protein kinase)|nr:serine/threonine-protein kinase RsbW [Solirubrobacteraceae bacterium]
MCFDNNENLIQSYPAIPSSVPAARRELTEFAVRAGAELEQLEAIRLAASEALTNVVVHAYRGYAGRIYVNADLAGDELWILIGDDGCGLQSDYESPGLGVGLALIAQSSDGLTIMNRGSGGTEVRMRFRLDAAQIPSDGQSDESRRSAMWPASSRFSTTT